MFKCAMFSRANVPVYDYMTKTDVTRLFMTSRFITLTTFFSNLGAIVELGQHQRGDLTVFRCVEFTSR